MIKNNKNKKIKKSRKSTRKKKKRSAFLEFFLRKRKVDNKKKPMFIHIIVLFFYFIIFMGFLFIGTLGIYSTYVYKEYDLANIDLSKAVWQLPSKVYARALEIYEGKKIKNDDLLKELRILNYTEAKDDASLSPGNFLKKGNSIIIYTKGFTFADKVELPIKVDVGIQNNTITRLIDSDSKQRVSITRLEPLQIGAIYPKHKEDRVLIKLDDAPPLLIDALLLAEDRRYYSHFGIDPIGIARALLQYIKSGGRFSQGGSTITQQFVKNHYLSNERKLSRKIKEAIISVVIESRFDKNTILEGYLNEIYLGQDGNRAIHGFGLASNYYFGKPLNRLGVHQIATLISLVREPIPANPYRNKKGALKRRNFMIEQFALYNLISKEDAEIAKSLPLDVIEKKRHRKIDRYYSFLSVVHRQLRKEYDLEMLGNGLHIFTTLDPIIQESAQENVIKTIPKLEKSKRLSEGFLQAASVIVDVHTGEVLSVIGDKDPNIKGFNRAIQARRQPGSLIKPAVYLSALEHPLKYSLATRMDDSPLKITSDNKLWQPKNYDKKNLENILLIDSLVKSRNIPTIRIGLNLGISDINKTIKRIGGPDIRVKYPSVVLGTEEMTPFEVAEMYETFANGGYKTPLRVIRNIVDLNGNTVARYDIETKKAIEELPYYLITYAMQEVVRRGTAASINNSIPRNIKIAGKTGTTDDYRDSWFAGFSGNILNVVWVGNDANKVTKLSGSSGALRVWTSIMSDLILKPVNNSLPRGILRVDVDKTTGELISDECIDETKAITLPFIRGSVPTRHNSCEQDIFDLWNDLEGSGNIEDNGYYNDESDVFELRSRR